MKKIVRPGVFETNSSSTHSLSVADENKEFVLDTIYPDQHGVIRVEAQEFGWSWDKINDAITKLAYAFQDSYGHEDLIKQVVMEQTGATEVIFDREDGYIDHQSMGTTQDIREDKEQMRNFIFNKNSWLFTGNDNGAPAPSFYHVPEFKDGKMIIPEFKYELSFDGLKDTVKYLDYPEGEELEDGINSLISDVLVNHIGQFIVEDSIYWQISRPRNTYYIWDWQLNQDYSKNEVLFLKEDDPRWRSLQNDIEKKKLPYHEREELLTEEALKIDGLLKKVKFTIKEL